MYEALSYGGYLWPVQNVHNYHSAYTRMYTHILVLVFSNILNSADPSYVNTYAFFTRIHMYIHFIIRVFCMCLIYSVYI